MMRITARERSDGRGVALEVVSQAAIGQVCLENDSAG
jgi:hypothetical protein